MVRQKCKDHLDHEFSSINEMCKYWNISLSTYIYRIKKGLTIEQALTKTMTKKKYKDHLDHEFSSIIEMCKYWNISWSTYDYRIKKGLTIEQALTGVYPHTKKSNKNKKYKLSQDEMKWIRENLPKYSNRTNLVNAAQKSFPNLTAYRIKEFIHKNPELKSYHTINITPEQIEFIKKHINDWSYSKLANQLHKKFNISISETYISKYIYQKLPEYFELHEDKSKRPIGEIFKQWDAINGWRLYQATETNRSKPYEDVIWEQHNGSKPRNSAIIFLDGDPFNCDIDNLACVSKKILGSLSWFYTKPKIKSIDGLKITKEEREIIRKNTKLAILTAEMNCIKSEIISTYIPSLAEQRMKSVGQTKTMRDGHTATIISCEKRNHMTVQFEDGTIKHNVRYTDFEKKRVAYPIDHEWNTEWFKKYVKENGDDCTVLGEYVTQNTKIKMRCNYCQREYFVTPNAFIHAGNRCNICRRKHPDRYKNV